jgi:hypothetical protein
MLTPDAALVDPGDDRSGIDFSCFFTIMYGWGNVAKETCLRFHPERLGVEPRTFGVRGEDLTTRPFWRDIIIVIIIIIKHTKKI